MHFSFRFPTTGHWLAAVFWLLLGMLPLCGWAQTVPLPLELKLVSATDRLTINLNQALPSESGRVSLSLRVSGLVPDTVLTKSFDWTQAVAGDTSKLAQQLIARILARKKELRKLNTSVDPENEAFQNQIKRSVSQLLTSLLVRPNFAMRLAVYCVPATPSREGGGIREVTLSSLGQVVSSDRDRLRIALRVQAQSKDARAVRVWSEPIEILPALTSELTKRLANELLDKLTRQYDSLGTPPNQRLLANQNADNRGQLSEQIIAQLKQVRLDAAIDPDNRRIVKLPDKDKKAGSSADSSKTRSNSSPSKADPKRATFENVLYQGDFFLDCAGDNQDAPRRLFRLWIAADTARSLQPVSPRFQIRLQTSALERTNASLDTAALGAARRVTTAIAEVLNNKTPSDTTTQQKLRGAFNKLPKDKNLEKLRPEVKRVIEQLRTVAIELLSKPKAPKAEIENVVKNKLDSLKSSVYTLSGAGQDIENYVLKYQDKFVEFAYANVPKTASAGADKPAANSSASRSATSTSEDGGANKDQEQGPDKPKDSTTPPCGSAPCDEPPMMEVCFHLLTLERTGLEYGIISALQRIADDPDNENRLTALAVLGCKRRLLDAVRDQYEIYLRSRERLFDAPKTGLMLASHRVPVYLKRTKYEVAGQYPFSGTGISKFKAGRKLRTGLLNYWKTADSRNVRIALLFGLIAYEYNDAYVPGQKGSLQFFRFRRGFPYSVVRMVQREFQVGYLNVDSVQMTTEDGNIYDLEVHGQFAGRSATDTNADSVLHPWARLRWPYESRAALFENYAPIGISTKRDLKWWYKQQLFSQGYERDSLYINLDEVLRYWPFLNPQTGSFCPADGRRSFRPDDPRERRVFYKLPTTKWLQARLYTDAIGLQENTPNGLVQLELNKRWSLNNRWIVQRPVYQTSWGNYLDYQVAITKSEPKDRRLSVNYVDGVLPRVHTIDLVRYTNLRVGTAANIVGFNFPYIKSQVYLDLSTHYNLVPTRDSLFNSQRTLRRVRDGEFSVVDYGIHLRLRAREQENIGYGARVGFERYVLTNDRGGEFGRETVIQRPYAAGKTFFGKVFYQGNFQYALWANFKTSATTDIFVRAQFTHLLRQSQYNFFQAQIGYQFDVFGTRKEVVMPASLFPDR
jgi:DUF971 family protein